MEQAAQAARDAQKRQSSLSSERKIAAVRRGNCSFETKVKVAAASGFAAIVVINNDNTAFPAGNTYTPLLAILADCNITHPLSTSIIQHTISMPISHITPSQGLLVHISHTLTFDNTTRLTFPSGAASLKFKSSIPCLMAGDSFLAVYKVAYLPLTTLTTLTLRCHNRYSHPPLSCLSNKDTPLTDPPHPPSITWFALPAGDGGHQRERS